MFNHLVESGSHTKDFKRRSRFFLGTLACYGLLFAALCVGSIYAYNVRLDESSDLELVSMMHFAPAEAPKVEEHRAAPKATAENNRPPRVAVIRELVKDTPYANNRPVAREDTPILPVDVPYIIGDHNFIPPNGGAPVGRGVGGDPTGTPGGTGLPVVRDTTEAPPLNVKPAPTPTSTPQRPTKINLTSIVLSGKAISKPAPPYPEIAKRARAAGIVTVQILVDEAGRVVSAQATSGHPFLLNAAVQAAYQARFTPTLLTGQPVKVSGVITYNFVLQ